MRPLRVLVVDDSPDAADSLALLLGLWGHEAVVAYNGSRALEAASARPFDVVLLDVGLPGETDGCELARRLRQLPGMGECLLVAVTGYGRDSDVQRCLEAGIDRHFVKPVDPSELQLLLEQERG